MNRTDNAYLLLLEDILFYGKNKSDRTGTGTISKFGKMIRFDMSEGFPLLTTKKMFTKGIITELLWFLSGETNISPLLLQGNNIWVGDAYKNYVKTIRDCGVSCNCNCTPVLSRTEFIDKIKSDIDFANQYGELGPIYGKQWVSWGGKKINQIENAIKTLKTNPDSRRIMVNAWNVSDLEDMVLPPCHFGFQLYTTELTNHERLVIASGNSRPTYDSITPEHIKHMDDVGIPTHKLSLMWSQRSVDSFLGLPFNIASYGFLLTMIAQQVNMIPDELIGSLGDVHIYNNHIQQASEQIKREPRVLPKLDLSCPKDIFSYTLEDFVMLGYDPHPPIKGELSN